MRFTCPKCGGVRSIHKSQVDDTKKTMSLDLDCGCALEFEQGKLPDEYKCAGVGDVVRYRGELWRVDSLDDDWVTLTNIDGTAHDHIDETEYIGFDSLSGLRTTKVSTGWTSGTQGTWPPGGTQGWNGYSYNQPRNYSNTPSSKKPRGPRDSISTAGLIQDEVKRLDNETKTRKFRTPTPKKTSTTSDDDDREYKPLKKRKGDW